MEAKTTTNLIGLYLLIFLLILIYLPINTYFSNLGNPLIESIIYVSSSGGLGGTIYCIRGFYKNVIGGGFDLKWTWWYIFRPFISIVVGIMSYFLIVGGLFSLGSVSEVNYLKSVMLYSGIAFLAGFSFSEFTDKLEELSSTLFSTKNEDDG
jgi:hypothetical protein